jgi:hypothetical protein
MLTAALYIAGTTAIVNSFRRALARNGIAPSGWQSSQVKARQFSQKPQLRKPTLVVAVLIGAAFFSEVNASMTVLSVYGQICVTVYDLRDEGQGRIRDDIAKSITSELQIKVSALQGLRKIRARPDCIKPGEDGFDRQLQLALYVKHQMVDLDGGKLNVVIIGGGSPNAGGLFADYDFQPIVIFQRDSVSDKTIEEKLIEYVDRNLVSTLRPEKKL